MEMPSRKRILCVTYHKNGTLAVAGERGLLKALEITFSEKPNWNSLSGDVDLPFTIQTHQSLKGHMYGVNNVSWKSDGERFASLDEKGL
jgi:hypothetical protein